jgi:uncharacterized protein involved in outer membrane biogenesis
MALKGVKLGLTARDGKVRLNPSEAALFGGRYQGDIRVDARAPQPRFQRFLAEAVFKVLRRQDGLMRAGAGT